MQQAVVQRCAEICLVVPVTPTTLQTRGFNQVAGWLAAPLAPGLMTQATAKSVPQSKKDRQARLRTPQPFKMAPNTILAGQRVLLVDDIYTTGRTMRHAATLLWKRCQERDGANTSTLISRESGIWIVYYSAFYYNEFKQSN